MHFSRFKRQVKEINAAYGLVDLKNSNNLNSGLASGDHAAHIRQFIHRLINLKRLIIPLYQD